MVSTGADSETRYRNLTIGTAICLGVPTAYAFQTLITDGNTAGDFLFLLTLAVGVPTVYDEYWPPHDHAWQAVAWVVAACALATVAFTGCYLVGTTLTGSTVAASVGAFFVTSLGPVAWFSARQ